MTGVFKDWNKAVREKVAANPEVFLKRKVKIVRPVEGRDELVDEVDEAEGSSRWAGFLHSGRHTALANSLCKQDKEHHLEKLPMYILPFSLLLRIRWGKLTC
jgi:hypothetical protein